MNLHLLQTICTIKILLNIQITKKIFLDYINQLENSIKILNQNLYYNNLYNEINEKKNYGLLIIHCNKKIIVLYLIFKTYFSK